VGAGYLPPSTKYLNKKALSFQQTNTFVYNYNIFSLF
jgi:hypothetical protein